MLPSIEATASKSDMRKKRQKHDTIWPCSQATMHDVDKDWVLANRVSSKMVEASQVRSILENV